MKKTLFFSLLLAVLLSCSVSDKSTLNNSPPLSTEIDSHEEKIISYQEKIKELTKDIKSNPNDPRLYFNRGLTKAYSEDHHGAIEDYNKAMLLSTRLKPQYLYYFYRGISYQMLQKNDEACKDWAIAAEVGLMKAAHNLINKHCI